MNKIAMLCCALAVLCLVPMAAVAQDKGSEIEATGEAVDISCYLTGKSGEGHAGCAAACVKGGKPIGFVVEKGGENMLLFVMGAGGKEAKDILGDHMGKQITVKGTYVEKDGMKILQVSEVVS